MDTAASVAAPAVSGMTTRRPPRRRRSRVPVSCSTAPAVRNSAPLNAAWFTMCSTAANSAVLVCSPSSRTIKPSWLTVELASSALRSTCLQASAPPQTSVTVPAAVTVADHVGSSANSGVSRAIRYRPALTIVAACR